jgi:hypothetical protein
VVEFATASPTHQPEPLSNSSLDSSLVTLTLQRTGDLSLPTGVRFITVDGSAKAGRDYLLTDGLIEFTAGQKVADLAVPILANHQLGHDTSFTVQLSSADGPTSIGTNSNVTVVIDNRELLGVYFPTIPQLCSAEEGGATTCISGALYSDLPLLCITVSMTC